ncbi:unnamed protein product [Tilletia controversa]|uniref:Acyltransferase 3 domain-containing protein n=2 Tax=Tilletia TaxID=13289 RepID=A0A177VFJ2_9BASI|nr:hypothetical protein CF336_g7286 [Tilletia laevis]KAE8187657.1 hypothetical protein CF328_g6848 [Tilletia controversa]KAE8249586.1 hypothetical protein A4X03_0g6587 [Tilletia caries]KAE8189726.1 hypothetical protein CF335_g6547 [Tilletia laevis]CAD6893332.1 unnamed protein product [Tilletia caries]
MSYKESKLDDKSGAVAADAAQAGPTTGTHGFRRLHGKDIWAVTPKAFTDDETNDLGRKRAQRIGYLEGLRGLLAIEIMLWSFFRILAPAIQTDTEIDGSRPALFATTAPEWQHTLRKALSPLFWDGTLQAGFFMMLNGRVVVETFLERRNAVSIAGSAFRRPLRFFFPLAIALAITSAVNGLGGFKQANAFVALTSNNFAAPPRIWGSTIEYFNALSGFFFATEDSFLDRGVQFVPPAPMMWFVPRVFMQSFTCYTFSYMLPFVLTKHKFWSLGIFTLATWWLGIWAWYSLTGLMIAELVVAYDLPAIAQYGIPIGVPAFINKAKKVHLASWLPPLVLLVLGVTLKYLWVFFPDRKNDEIIWHFNKFTGGLNHDFPIYQIAFPRLDDWFVCTGAFFLLEMSHGVRVVFDNFLFKAFARISFPLFLLSGTVFMSLGTFLHQHLYHSQNWTSEAALLGVEFAACIPLAIGVATAFHFVVEEPSIIFSRWLFKWLRED